ncbi:uncharacterized protein LOC115682147 isoform X2 [Syzygium oleosum]|nr:uncharacterized protein LOC115682147 isoform X2 [Syzygium oleosum]XP_030462151.1 uncharacterized protein LOC115682147 isoform X2 [Syzygium oleosum]XP_056169401.1 uncharacterized protein LOC115682147 isoform X2 [Syzygium oleosum]
MASQKEAFIAKWTEPLTNLYISLLVEEVKKGNRTSSTFNKAGWNNIRAEFNKRTVLQYNLVQLKNKVNKLKKQYCSFRKLLSQSGFAWDNINKTVVVDDPSIWEPHIKDNREWAKFKKDGLPQYPELCIVFGDTYATGEHAVGNAENLMMSEEDDYGGSDPEDFSEHYIDEGVFTSDNTSALGHDKHKLDRTPNTKRRRKSNSYNIASTCKAIQEMIKCRASQYVSCSATSQVTPPPVDPFSVSAVIDVLVSMPELEQNLYNKAVERACISATWREAFIKSPTERRNGLLRYLK